MFLSIIAMYPQDDSRAMNCDIHLMKFYYINSSTSQCIIILKPLYMWFMNLSGPNSTCFSVLCSWHQWRMMIESDDWIVCHVDEVIIPGSSYMYSFCWIACVAIISKPRWSSSSIVLRINQIGDNINNRCVWYYTSENKYVSQNGDHLTPMAFLPAKSIYLSFGLFARREIVDHFFSHWSSSHHCFSRIGVNVEQITLW